MDGVGNRTGLTVGGVNTTFSLEVESGVTVTSSDYYWQVIDGLQYKFLMVHPMVWTPRSIPLTGRRKAMRVFTGLVATASILIGTPGSADSAFTTLYYRTLSPYPVPIINVKINSSLVRTFVVDTGANISIVSKETARQLRLDVKAAVGGDGKPLYLFDRTDRPADMVTPAQFQVGSLALRKVPLMLMDEKEIHALLGDDIDGIIGTNIFMPGAVVFRFSQQRIELHYPGLSRAEVASLGFSEDNSTRIQDKNNDFRFTVPVQLDKHVKEDLLIDTGAPWTIVSNASGIKLQLRSVSTSPVNTRTFFGDVPCKRGTLETIEMAGFSQSMFRIAYGTAPTAKIGPILGLDLLTRYDILINYPERMMYVARPRQALSNRDH